MHEMSMPADLPACPPFLFSPLPQVIAVGPTGQRYNVSRYYARWQQPRPESYM